MGAGVFFGFVVIVSLGLFAILLDLVGLGLFGLLGLFTEIWVRRCDMANSTQVMPINTKTLLSAAYQQQLWSMGLLECVTPGLPYYYCIVTKDGDTHFPVRNF